MYRQLYINWEQPYLLSYFKLGYARDWDTDLPLEIDYADYYLQRSLELSKT
jgi:hypothetical protein